MTPNGSLGILRGVLPNHCAPGKCSAPWLGSQLTKQRRSTRLGCSRTLFGSVPRLHLKCGRWAVGQWVLVSPSCLRIRIGIRWMWAASLSSVSKYISVEGISCLLFPWVQFFYVFLCFSRTSTSKSLPLWSFWTVWYLIYQLQRRQGTRFWSGTWNPWFTLLARTRPWGQGANAHKGLWF